MPSDTLLEMARASLEEERDQLRHQLDDLGLLDGTGLEFDENFADSAQVAAEQGEQRALGNQLREQLREVEHALQKLDAGSYGVCERCGNQIAEPRLEAMPSTRFCIDCAA